MPLFGPMKGSTVSKSTVAWPFQPFLRNREGIVHVETISILVLSFHTATLYLCFWMQDI